MQAWRAAWVVTRHQTALKRREDARFGASGPEIRSRSSV